MEALIAAAWGVILELWPWTTIDPWELALRVRWGRRLKALKPGVRVCLPFIDRVILEPATLQTVNIADQTIVTMDRVNASVSGVIKYWVRDLESLWFAVHDSDDTIANTALEAVAAHVAMQDFVDLYPVPLGKKVQRSLRQEVKSWGIEVKSFRITDLADSTVHRIMSSSGESTLVLGGSE